MRHFRQLTGRGSGRKLALDGLRPGAVLCTGRDPEADFVIDEEHISGFHLEIEIQSDSVLVRDLQSTNGSVVVRAGQEIPLGEDNDYVVVLQDGDVLHLGDPTRPVHLTYSEASAEEQPTKQEVLAIAHLTGVAEYESRIRQNPALISKLYEFSKRLTGQEDPARVGQVLADAIFEVFPTATHVFVDVERATGDELIHFLGVDRDGNALSAKQASRSVIEEVLKKKAGVLVADATSVAQPARSIMRLGIQTVIAAPLWIGDRVTGVVQADNRGGRGAFTQPDLELVTVLAGQASLAIENARLVSHLRAAEVNLTVENRYLKEGVERKSEIIGSGPAIERVFSLIEKVQNTRVPVCIEGETGTGKELVARAIHFRSNRRAKLFVTQNCAAIPESILESELFGHVRGAFTGADRNKRGLFEIADHGTIFLDEIGETSPSMQAKLLRVLQEGEVRAVGAVRPKMVDVRVISATNRNLEEEVEQGRFREDLYYRLKVFPIKLPPLRERKEDIPLLARHFLDQYSREANRSVPAFGPEALALLLSYRWPGNVRELQNEIQRIIIGGEGGDFVMPEHLSERLRAPGDLLERVNPKRGGLKQMLEEVEKWILLDALRDHGNNKTQTAESLKISREGLHKKLSRYGL